MQLWLHLSLDFDPNSFSFFMHLHHLAYRGQQFPGMIFISRPLSHPCAIYISAETRASRATLFWACEEKSSGFSQRCVKFGRYIASEHEQSRSAMEKQICLKPASMFALMSAKNDAI